MSHKTCKLGFKCPQLDSDVSLHSTWSIKDLYIIVSDYKAIYKMYHIINITELTVFTVVFDCNHLLIQTRLVKLKNNFCDLLVALPSLCVHQYCVLVNSSGSKSFLFDCLKSASRVY